ncbi:hypothetical protein Tsubulata_020492 [Turnera subulata]|uniref:Growth-regulating factor n=1 Tax=Turnera subulata TaxID=218843 RepID=A0A9Q0G7A3_9ROSI|nr:hypothetical protein Tsubulata_020492 [Turnera subulata]
MQEMESQAPPSKIARFADSSRIGEVRSSGDYMESNGGPPGSPPIGLGLELGRGGSGGRASTSNARRACGFTILQMQELQLQSLIYKYMEAGFPVPRHLVLPIWKSVSSSFGGFTASLYQLYPSFVGCNPLYLEYKNGMDPEPGRCRRTDGKKWRCSKQALPDQKYCDRHMHRGRQRSRKLVEASPLSSSSSSSATETVNLSISLQGSGGSSSSSNLSLSFPFSPRSVLYGYGRKN